MSEEKEGGEGVGVWWCGAGKCWEAYVGVRGGDAEKDAHMREEHPGMRGMPFVADGTGGDCQECGGKLTWCGMRWGTHTRAYHQGVRKRLYGAVALLVTQEAELREFVALCGAQEFVGLRWRCGVYPGWQAEQRIGVPQEMWDLGAGWQEQYLRDTRWALAEGLEWEHGVKVNPATWFHKVYDPRVGGEKP